VSAATLSAQVFSAGILARFLLPARAETPEGPDDTCAWRFDVPLDRLTDICEMIPSQPLEVYGASQGKIEE